MIELSRRLVKKTPSKETIYDQVKEFSSCRKSLSHDVRESRPRSAVTLERIHALKKLITFNRHVMHDEVEISLNILRICVHLILYYHLKAKKVCSQ